MIDESNMDERAINRIHRVWSVLKGREAFKSYLQSDCVTLTRKGESIAYPAMCIDIVGVMDEQKIDACTASKADIIRQACTVLNLDMDTVEIPADKPELTQKEKLPTLVRIRRAASVLKSWPKLATLSKDTVDITTARGFQRISVDVVGIANYIHASNMDVCSMKKEAIFEYADRYASEGQSHAPSADQLADISCKSGIIPEDSESKPADDLQEVSVTDVESPEKSEPFKPKVKSNDHEIDIPWTVSIYTLLVSALQISQLDKKDGAPERRKVLENLANQYYQQL